VYVCHRQNVRYVYVCHRQKVRYVYVCHRQKVRYVYVCHRQNVRYMYVCHRQNADWVHKTRTQVYTVTLAELLTEEINDKLNLKCFVPFIAVRIVGLSAVANMKVKFTNCTFLCCKDRAFWNEIV
jgi:hypothetical protein